MKKPIYKYLPVCLHLDETSLFLLWSQDKACDWLKKNENEINKKQLRQRLWNMTAQSTLYKKVISEWKTKQKTFERKKNQNILVIYKNMKRGLRSIKKIPLHLIKQEGFILRIPPPHPPLTHLTHPPWDKMAAISQLTFWKAFS